MRIGEHALGVVGHEDPSRRASGEQPTQPAPGAQLQYGGTTHECRPRQQVVAQQQRATPDLQPDVREWRRERVPQLERAASSGAPSLEDLVAVAVSSGC